jgi:hypothetical protein
MGFIGVVAHDRRRWGSAELLCEGLQKYCAEHDEPIGRLKNKKKIVYNLCNTG